MKRLALILVLPLTGCLMDYWSDERLVTELKVCRVEYSTGYLDPWDPSEYQPTAVTSDHCKSVLREARRRAEENAS